MNLQAKLNLLFQQRKTEILKEKWPRKAEIIGRFKGKRVKIYYLKLEKEEKPGKIYFKLGITSKSVEERIESLRFPKEFKIEVIDYANFSGIVGICLEKYLHNRFKHLRIREKIIESGNSEIYMRDVLEMERKKIKR